MLWFKKTPTVDPADAAEEHRISLPGVEIAFNHLTKVALMVDQTGTKDVVALQALEDWLRLQGWFLHCVVIVPPEKKPEVKDDDGRRPQSG